MTVSVTVGDALENMARFLRENPAVARRAARYAINDTADTGRRKVIPAAMREEINFPAGYIESEDRLRVSVRATDDNLQAVVEGRQRATSLARFAPALALGVKAPKGVRVQIKPGRSVTLQKAFPVRLRAGASSSYDHYNLGLAVRVGKGQTLRGSTAAVEIFDGVFLLYGPSVDQVAKTVFEDVAPGLGDALETEFLRQFVRLSDEIA